MRFALVVSLLFALAGCATQRPAEVRHVVWVPAPVPARVPAPVVRARPRPMPVVHIGRYRPRTSSPVNVDRLAQHNLDRINAYRRTAGVAPLALDARLSAFALEGTRELVSSHTFHGHIGRASRADLSRAGFGDAWAENQGGETRALPDAIAKQEKQEKQVDDILEGMMREGPGGGHHDNILAPKMKRLGVGIVVHDDGALDLTNDFST